MTQSSTKDTDRFVPTYTLDVGNAHIKTVVEKWDYDRLFEENKRLREENARLIEKYDLQLLVQREKRLREALENAENYIAAQHALNDRRENES